MATLYLELQSVNTQDRIEGILSCSSAVCLFVHNVLMEKLEDNFCSVVLVTNNKYDSKEVKPSEILHLENGHSFTKQKEVDCPKNIQYCELPVLVTSGGNMVHCGLCSVVRKLVKLVHGSFPSRKFIRLLGHHAMCLRACSEVSVWTKFCEVEMVSLVQELYQCQTSEHLVIPQELIRFEQHLQQPAVIPQIGKRKKEIYNLLTNKDNEGSSIPDTDWIAQMSMLSLKDFMENTGGDIKHIEKEVLEVLASNKKLCHNVNIPGLDHIFAEGADITLTDLVLLPSFSCILKYIIARHGQMLNQIPHVLDWYKRMVSNDIIRESLQKVGIPILDISSHHFFTEPANDVTLSPVTSDKKLVKQKVKVSTAEASMVLASLQGINLTIEDNPVYSSCQCKLDWSNIPAAVHPAKGNLPDSRISRKCEQLENLALALQSIAKPKQVIVDFCAGGGHLGILLAHLLPECHIILVENKEESISRAEIRVKELELTNITLCQSNLDYFKGTFDIGTCLHACGVATDLVLDKCLKANASFVVCPCCYGGVQNTHTLNYPRSQHFKHQINYENFLLLAHAADDEKTGKDFMIAVDQDRAKHAEELGYKMTLCSLKPLACSPKNNLLIGVKNS